MTYPESPLTVMCFFSKNPSPAIFLHCGFSDQALLDGGGFELALRSWWIFIRRVRFVLFGIQNRENREELCLIERKNGHLKQL